MHGYDAQRESVSTAPATEFPVGSLVAPFVAAKQSPSGRRSMAAIIQAEDAVPG